jgi:N-acylglucosamine-6-phosphate 2-epimerase
MTGPQAISGETMPTSAAALLDQLRGGLIVSCQPVAGGPLDRPEIVAAFALAAAAGGARGLRIEGLANLRAVRAATSLPIIGLVKKTDPASPVIITPTAADVRDLAAAGADIVAFDATRRSGRPETVEALAAAAHGAGRLAMADLATLADAEAAVAAGVEILGTTLSGYTGGPVPEAPDVGLVRACAALPRPVYAEGRYRTFDEVRAARAAGAAAVVIGSAITRPEHVTGWYAAVMAEPLGGWQDG